MDRGVVGIAWGVLLGALVTMIVAWAADYVFPPSLQVDLDPQLGRTSPMRLMAVLLKLLGSGGGAYLGGLIAVRGVGESGWPSWAVGGALGVAALILHFVWPHPLWFLALRLLVVGGAAYAAGRLWRVASTAG